MNQLRDMDLALNDAVQKNAYLLERHTHMLERLEKIRFALWQHRDYLNSGMDILALSAMDDLAELVGAL